PQPSPPRGEGGKNTPSPPGGEGEVRGGWSIKAMHRLILLSNTYQMSSVHNERAVLADPDNRLHWRWQRRRLDAEEVRDALPLAPQALFMMNSKLVLEQTRHLAADLLRRSDCDDAGRVRLAYERAYGRSPTATETARALAFVRRVDGLLAGEKLAPAERWLRA